MAGLQIGNSIAKYDPLDIRPNRWDPAAVSAREQFAQQAALNDAANAAAVNSAMPATQDAYNNPFYPAATQNPFGGSSNYQPQVRLEPTPKQYEIQTL